jgi:Leucine-rich repeat (LRR) protein
MCPYRPFEMRKKIVMNDLDVIRRIESKLEFPLRKISLEEIEKVAQWTTKAYAVDGNGKVTGLQLDGYAISPDAELNDLCHLTMLVLRNAHLEKAKILNTLDGLTSLGLSGTEVTDVSFLKELKGLTSLYLHRTKPSVLILTLNFQTFCKSQFVNF